MQHELLRILSLFLPVILCSMKISIMFHGEHFVSGLWVHRFLCSTGNTFVWSMRTGISGMAGFYAYEFIVLLRFGRCHMMVGMC